MLSGLPTTGLDVPFVPRATVRDFTVQLIFSLPTNLVTNCFLSNAHQVEDLYPFIPDRRVRLLDGLVPLKVPKKYDLDPMSYDIIGPFETVSADR